MKILAFVHGYPKIHNAGAEWMLHSMLKYAVEQGADAEVLLPISDLKPYTFEGVKVNRDVFGESREKIKNCDIVLTHLDRYGKANNMSEFYSKPLVLIVHNSHIYPGMNSRWDYKKYAIYNSMFTAGAVKYKRPSIIVHPPVVREDYKTKPGKLVTLVNLFEPKGGKVLQEIAAMMPETKFLGVRGGYGQQEIGSLKNIKYIDNTPDMKKIYGQTRILLMPSSYESYGRVAVEAMASGIPVIAHPTPGLKECLQVAGIFCDRKDPKAWAKEIERLSDPAEYKKASELALKRSDEIDALTKSELKEMMKFFNLITNGKI
jgi:glycosyltransferase involved in cell wall biosynthesis